MQPKILPCGVSKFSYVAITHGSFLKLPFMLLVHFLIEMRKCLYIKKK